MAGFDFKGLMQSPAMGVGMGALGAGMKTMQGNQAAQASQETAKMNAMYGGTDFRTANMMGALGQHGLDKPGMGTSSLANIMAKNGGQLTAKQGRSISPQVRKNLQAQGAVAPSFMQNLMSPQMIMSMLQLFGGQGQQGQQAPQEEQQPTGGGY